MRMKTDQEVLRSMATYDELIDHDIEECGMCYHQWVMAQTARDMIAAGELGENCLQEWTEKSKKRWEEGKYFKLWQEETAAGRDPHVAFAEKGWEA